MNRTRVRRRRSLTIVSLGVVVAVWAGPVGHAVAGGPLGSVGSGTADASQSFRRYVVRPGDTLWSIARRFSPELDPRQVVDALQQANGVDPGRLVPGREIVIPDQV
jgi:nucleoid-associated protein YgaU